jgi:hypothetical protein
MVGILKQLCVPELVLKVRIMHQQHCNQLNKTGAGAECSALRNSVRQDVCREELC